MNRFINGAIDAQMPPENRKNKKSLCFAAMAETGLTHSGDRSVEA